jgi:4-amino-4-deoxy-L-arabinose transferase-like glycosyltransferase
MLRGAVHRARALLAQHRLLVVLTAIAVVVSFIVRHEVFAAFSWNRDEPVYLWQARLLRAGHLTSPASDTPAFFQPWLTGLRHGAFFSQYTPGWPIALAAADLVFGSSGVAVALAAGLVVPATYAFARELGFERPIALVSAAVMTVSPILIIQSGLYLGYLFSLALGLWFGTALLAGIRRSSVWLFLVAGGLVGLIFLTRPFDAVLWVVPFAVYLGITRRSELRTLLRPGAWVGVGVLPFFLLGLAYNRKVTGSFTQFPITAADPLDSFGFGLRRIMPLWTPINFTVSRAVRGTGRNLVYLPQFLFGSYLSVVVAGGALWLGRRDKRMLALLALGAAFPLGYFIFWGIYLSGARVALTGPIYYVPLFAPISILIASAIVTVWRHRHRLGVALIAALAVATVPFLVNQIHDNKQFSDAQAPWRDATGTHGERALVFVERSSPYLLHLNPFSTNPNDLDTERILWSVDRGPRDLELIARRPGRTPYFQIADKLPGVLVPPPVPHVSLVPITVVESPTVTVHVTITNTTGAPVVVAYLRVAHRQETRILDTDSKRGKTYETDWVISAPHAPGVDASDPEVITFVGRTSNVAFGVQTGRTATSAAHRPLLEQQLSYRVVDGTSAEVLVPTRGFRIHFDKRDRAVLRRKDVRDAISVEVEDPDGKRQF